MSLDSGVFTLNLDSLINTWKTPASGPSRLSAEEAARRETLYAYVSRGLIHSESQKGARERLYLAEDVEQLVRRRQGRRDPAAAATLPPLERFQVVLAEVSARDLRVYARTPDTVKRCGLDILRLLAASAVGKPPSRAPVAEVLQQVSAPAHPTPYGAVVAGLSALRSTQHRGLSEQVEALFDESRRLPVLERSSRPAFGLPPDSALALTAIARSVGWVAHVLEQCAANSLNAPARATPALPYREGKRSRQCCVCSRALGSPDSAHFLAGVTFAFVHTPGERLHATLTRVPCPPSALRRTRAKGLPFLWIQLA